MTREDRRWISKHIVCPDINTATTLGCGAVLPVALMGLLMTRPHCCRYRGGLYSSQSTYRAKSGREGRQLEQVK